MEVLKQMPGETLITPSISSQRRLVAGECESGKSWRAGSSTAAGMPNMLRVIQSTLSK